MKNLPINTFLALSILSGGYIFYNIITNTTGIISCYLSPIFLVMSVLAIVIPSKPKIGLEHKYLTSFLVWLFTLGASLALISWYDKLSNMSPVIYSVAYYQEEGIYLDFRKNGTFKVRNENMLEGSLSYGKYKITGNTIILMDEIYWEASKVNDTLTITDSGIKFKLETPHRGITEATMYFVPK